MARQSKIVKYSLTTFVLDLRERGKTAKQIAAAVNDELAHLGVDDSVDTAGRAIERHFATLDAASVAPAHQPLTAERNAGLAVDVAARLGLMDEHLVKWMHEADLAAKPIVGVVYDVLHQKIKTPDDMGRDQAIDPDLADADEDHPCVQVYEIDWQARTSTSRELRELVKTVADVLQRVHDAGQVQAFQQAVMEAIMEASPEVAAAVVAKMREKQSIVRAHLLGAT